MANRVILGKHPSFGQGLFVSRTGIDVNTATEEDIITFCRQHLAGFKAPKTIIFQEIPKTSTGKIQKYLLRQSLQDTE